MTEIVGKEENKELFPTNAYFVVKVEPAEVSSFCRPSISMSESSLLEDKNKLSVEKKTKFHQNRNPHYDLHDTYQTF